MGYALLCWFGLDPSFGADHADQHFFQPDQHIHAACGYDPGNGQHHLGVVTEHPVTQEVANDAGKGAGEDQHPDVKAVR